MKTKVLLLLSGLFFITIFCRCSCNECCLATSKTIVICENHTIPANTGISIGQYTEVDSFRYVNILVEFSQDSLHQEAVSLGVIFAHDAAGKWGSRRYFNFEQNFSAPADPQMITLTGKNSWAGSSTGKSHYIARLPIMGPYLQVYPFNHHDQARQITIVLYLTT